MKKLLSLLAVLGLLLPVISFAAFTTQVGTLAQVNAGQGGIGTSTPTGLFAIFDTPSNANATIITVASSTTAFATTTFWTLLNSGNFGLGTSSPVAQLDIQALTSNTIPFLVASSSGATIFSLDQWSHVISGGQAPTCGAGCSAVFGDDQTMQVVVGAGVTSITVNFAHTYTKSPTCLASEESAGTVVVGASSTPTTVVLTAASSLTDKSIGVLCQISNNFTF
jgi:hypothetical protein